MRLRRQGSDRNGRQFGQAVLEFTLLLPILMLLLLGAIDFGRVMFSWIQVANAAREGAAYAITNPTDILGVTSIASRAQQESNSQAQKGEGSLQITVVCNESATRAVVPCDNTPITGLGSTVTVSVSEPFAFFTPVIGGIFPNFRLTSSSTGFLMSPLNGVAPAPSPSPSPSPSPTPTSTASPTPTPTASPTPTPTPRLCPVPDFVGQHAGSNLVGMWTAAGFDSTNFSNTVPGNGVIKGQSLGAGTQQPCATAQIILN